MSLITKLDDVDWLKNFNVGNSNDISFDLYSTFANSQEEFEKFWNMFSDFYYISCYPFEDKIEQRKNIPEIYNILKRCAHMANGYPLEILIGKYSDEAMERARKVTEEKRKEFEWSWIVVWDPKSFVYLVWFWGGSSWRNNQYIINEIKQTFPDKINILKFKL